MDGALCLAYLPRDVTAGSGCGSQGTASFSKDAFSNMIRTQWITPHPEPSAIDPSKVHLSIIDTPSLWAEATLCGEMESAYSAQHTTTQLSKKMFGLKFHDSE
jgi:hypothetical protein